MGDFKKRFGGDNRGGFGGRGGNRQDNSWSRPGGRDRGPVTMHQAVCAQCGNPCEVPFRPISGKPVYCNNCFQGKKDSGFQNRDRFPRKSFDSHNAFAKPDFRDISRKDNDGEIKNQLAALNEKLDKLARTVEALANIKPLAAEEKTKEEVKTVPAVKVKKLVKKFFKKKEK